MKTRTTKLVIGLVVSAVLVVLAAGFVMKGRGAQNYVDVEVKAVLVDPPYVAEGSTVNGYFLVKFGDSNWQRLPSDPNEYIPVPCGYYYKSVEYSARFPYVKELGPHQTQIYLIDADNESILGTATWFYFGSDIPYRESNTSDVGGFIYAIKSAERSSSS